MHGVDVEKEFLEKQASEEEPEDFDLDDDGGTKFTEYNVRRDNNNPHFCIGMLFSTKTELKDVIMEYAISGGYYTLHKK